MDFAVQYRFGAYSAEVITGDDRDVLFNIILGSNQQDVTTCDERSVCK